MASPAETGAWDLGWDAILAFAAVGLGLVTAWLGWQTRRLAIEARGQIALQQGEAEAAQRPIVYPVVPIDWMRNDSGMRDTTLIIRNGGLGPAVSVNGTIDWHHEGDAPGTAPAQAVLWPAGSLGPGEERVNRLTAVGEWHNARGKLVYSDLSGGEWQTVFSFQVESDDVIVLRVAEISRM